MRGTHWIRRTGLLLGLAAIWAGPVQTAGADDYPEGCVDCHSNRQGEADYRLNRLLSQIGHPALKRIKKVPRDCTRCHSSDPEDGEPTFSQLIHEIHFDVPATNLYVRRHGGDCRGCHVMDVEEGEAQLKNGAANW